MCFLSLAYKFGGHQQRGSVLLSKRDLLHRIGTFPILRGSKASVSAASTFWPYLFEIRKTLIHARHSTIATKHSSACTITITTTNVTKTTTLLATRMLAARNTALRLPGVEDDLIAIAVEDDLRVAEVLLAALLGARNATPGSAVGSGVLHGVSANLFALAGEDWRAGGVVFGGVVPGAGVPFVGLGGGPLATKGDVSVRKVSFWADQ